MVLSVCVPNLKIVRADGGRGGRQLRNTVHIYIKKWALITVSLRLCQLRLALFIKE
jgi:hypothetical protein